MADRYSRSLALLPDTVITTAVTGSVGPTIKLPEGPYYLALQATFVYGSAGTTAKAWVQTSVDGGLTWRDVASFAFTTASAKKTSALSTSIALAAAQAASDGALADDTILNGLIGDRLRVKYTTTGTYAGGTTLSVYAVPKG